MSDLRKKFNQFAATQPQTLAMVWLAVTFVWVVVIFTTELPAWTIAIWIAATIGSIATLEKADKKLKGQAED